MYSRRKGAINTLVNAVPPILVVAVNFLNKQFNLGWDDTTVNSVAISLSLGYYWVKNWFKNKN